MRLVALVAAVGGLTVTGPAAALAQPRVAYRTVMLGTLGGADSVPLALNDRGMVVGWSNTADGALHPFRWQHGRMTDLGVPGGDVVVTDLNNHDQVVGSAMPPDRPAFAYLWQRGRGVRACARMAAAGHSRRPGPRAGRRPPRHHPALSRLLRDLRRAQLALRKAVAASPRTRSVHLAEH